MCKNTENLLDRKKALASECSIFPTFFKSFLSSPWTYSFIFVRKKDDLIINGKRVLWPGGPLWQWNMWRASIRASIRMPTCRAPDKVHIFISIMPISSPNPIFYHLLESSRRDDSNKWLNIWFNEEVTEEDSIKHNSMHLIWSSANMHR